MSKEERGIRVNFHLRLFLSIYFPNLVKKTKHTTKKSHHSKSSLFLQNHPQSNVALS